MSDRRDTLIAHGDVREMFDHVAPRYDLLNRVLSLGIDRSWRRRAIGMLGLAPGDTLIDVCGGTGDLSLTAARLVPGVRVLNVDFSKPMLAHAEDKRPGAPMANVQGDAMRLPVADRVVAGAVIGFGIRNVSDRLQALAECCRVLRPGGRLVVLEFAEPRAPLVRGPYLFYLKHVLPRLASAVTARPSAYAYLGDSIVDFPEREQFAELMRDAGFDSVEWADVTGGIAVLYAGTRPS